METFIISLFLSDFMVFVLVGVLMIGLTVWAISQHEIAGYVLGVLIGIFMILLLSSILPEASTSDEPMERLSFLGIFIPGLFGLIAGVGLPMLMMNVDVRSRRTTQALYVATLMSIFISTGYLMLIASQMVRLMIGVFILTMMIGVLLVNIFNRRAKPAEAETPPLGRRRRFGTSRPYDTYE